MKKWFVVLVFLSLISGVLALGEEDVENNECSVAEEEKARIKGITWAYVGLGVLGLVGVLVLLMWIFGKKKQGVENVGVRDEKAEREARVKEKEDREMLAWVLKAIRMGYSEEKVSGLIDNGKLSRDEVRKILEIYRREVGG